MGIFSMLAYGMLMWDVGYGWWGGREEDEPILTTAKNHGLLNWSLVLPELLNPGWIEVFDLFEPVTD